MNPSERDFDSIPNSCPCMRLNGLWVTLDHHRTRDPTCGHPSLLGCFGSSSFVQLSRVKSEIKEIAEQLRTMPRNPLLLRLTRKNMCVYVLVTYM